MFYGNLIALMQKDFKRLLGFSGIAHAGYALIGFVALDQAGYTAALYYIIGYLFMVLACFVVICKVSRDGTNVAIEDLAGLHRRSPLLAVTLVVGVFALAGIPPFVGFMGKLTLLTAALAQGPPRPGHHRRHQHRHRRLTTTSASSAKPGSAIPATAPPIRLDWPTRALCVLLIAGILALGIAPARVLNTLSTSVAAATGAPPPTTSVLANSTR